MMIGVDYHPSFQTIAFLMEETGESGEQELNHSDGQAERFYRGLQQRGICVRVGMEATGYSLSGGRLAFGRCNDASRSLYEGMTVPVFYDADNPARSIPLDCSLTKIA